MARHRSPQSRGAHRTLPSPREPLFATTGVGGAHRAVDPTTRRNLLAVGGVAVLAGQVAFSHLTGTMPALPGPGDLLGLEPTESTITELAATAPPSTRFEAAGAAQAAFEPAAQVAAPLVETGPLASRYDGLEPISMTGDPSSLQQADAAKLAKAAGLAEAARQAQEQAARRAEQARLQAADAPHVRGRACAPNTSGLAGVKSWVTTAGTELRCIFDVKTLGGLGTRSNASDHPRGLAIDFMTTNGENGDQLADYALKYKDELRIKYVIWKQRINYGNGWKGMENRGSATANHFDHVHISFTN